ncbi:MAG: glycosyltransferase family 39 protein [Ardenticatenaceae bacterium]|nr:glycosyltransferase family 39 protein [Ardenticatenaceae bacterium]
MKEKRWLVLVIASYVVLAGAYSWVVPLGESPDEVDHFLYVRYLVENREFPVMHPNAAENETMEANQPPLFYLLNAVLTGPLPMTATADFPLNACFTFDPFDGGRAHFYLHASAEQAPLSADYLAFRAARLVSVVLGVLTIWLTYRLGRYVTMSSGPIGLLAAGILAFNPQFIFMTASVNNDVLTAVLGAALVYFTVEAGQTPSLKRFVGLGILMGLGLLTKFALLALWPLPLLAIFLTADKKQPRRSVQYVAVVLVLPLLVAGWWYFRAYLLYGDPLAWDVHLQAKGAEVLRTTPLTLTDLREFVVIHFQSYWAWFGWLKIKAASWVYAVLAMWVFVAMLGLLLVSRDGLRQLQATGVGQWRSWLRKNMGVTAVLLSLLATGVIYASLFRYIQTINWSGYQGRLAYAAVAPMAVLLAVGWERTAVAITQLGRSQRTTGQKLWYSVPLVGLLALALVSLGQLNAAYDRATIDEPPASWLRVCQETPGGFYVEAVDYKAVVSQGESFVVSLAGYGADADGLAGEVALLNWDGAVLATAVLQQTSIAKDQVVGQAVLSLPPDVQPAAARLVFLVENGSVDLGPVKIAADQTGLPEPDVPVAANFANEIALMGYDLQIESGVVRLKTYWQAQRPIEASYTIFVHLLDGDGVLVAQQDALPQGGAYPTTIWAVGEVVVDEAVLSLPPEAKPATLSIGLYQLDTLERLPLVGAVTGENLSSQTDNLLLTVPDEGG